MKDIKKNATIKTKVKQSSKKETPFNIDLNYSEEYDSFNIKVKKDVGFMSYTDSLQGLPLEVAQKLNEMLEEVLIKAGSEYEMKEHKMYAGGFMNNVYAKGGSLISHGLEIGDTIVRTISGGILKIRDRNGMIVYVNLATGERDKQPPLPFMAGGKVKFVKPADQDIDLTDDKVLRVRKPVMPDRKISLQEFMAKNNSSMEAMVYPSNKKMATGGGVGLIGNQKRIDMNKNGKIDAEDFKIMRETMNGAWRNERKHVNHNEDYEVRYAKPRPTRTGYKGKRNFDN
jgi:hypothetical protein